MSGTDKSLTDHNWPIDYPFVALRDFQPNQPIPGLARLNKDDRGRVTTRADNNGNICVELGHGLDGEPGALGWVPLICIEIGKRRTVTEGPIVHIEEPHLTIRANEFQSGTNNILANTISGILTAYHNHRETLPTEPPLLKDLTPNKIQNLTVRIMHGIGYVSKELLNKLASGQFTIDDIRRLSHDATKSSKAGIYLILYRAFHGKPSRPGAIYTGSTGVDFQSRNEGHLRDMKNFPARNHYRAAANAKERYIFPICYLDSQTATDQELKVIEQLFINLFDTFSPKVLSFDSKDFVGEGDDSEPNVEPGALSRAATYIVQKEQASILQRLSAQVSEVTGWPGGTGRFDFGAVTGLNWTSPLAEMQHTKTTWVKTVSPGKFANFRRTDFKAHLITSGSDRDNLCIFSQSYTQEADWRALLPGKEKSTWPPWHNSKYHVIFELRLDDKDHKVPLARMPTVGPFSDWDDVNQIAMRVEFTGQDGQWTHRYYQMGTADDRVKNAPLAGGVQGYNVATGLRAYFLQQDRTMDEAAKKWMWNFGIARIKEVYVDHLLQEVRVRELVQKSRVPGPTRKALTAINHELRDLGVGRLANPDATAEKYPLFPGNRTQSDRQRKNCDSCAANKLLGRPDGRMTKCERVPGKNQCQRCLKWGRWCTFTHTTDLNKPKILHGLTYPNAKPLSGRVFDDRTITYTY